MPKTVTQKYCDEEEHCKMNCNVNNTEIDFVITEQLSRKHFLSSDIFLQTIRKGIIFKVNSGWSLNN